jgi:hypothetical protein
MTTSLNLRPMVDHTVSWEPSGQMQICDSVQIPQEWNRQFDPNAAHAFGVVSTPVRLGKCAARFELRKTDSNNVSGSTRAELSAKFREPEGTTCWYGFSIYLPTTWIPDPLSGEILTQWHQEDPDIDPNDPNDPDLEFAGPPPLALMTKNGKWMVSLRENWDNRVSDKIDDRDVGDYDTGQWTDWVVSVVWSPVKAGMIRVWKNGRTVYDESGIQTKFNDGKGNYIKFGIYKWDWAKQNTPSVATERSMFYDELRISRGQGSWRAVSPDSRWFLDWLLDLFRHSVFRILRR